MEPSIDKHLHMNTQQSKMKKNRKHALLRSLLCKKQSQFSDNLLDDLLASDDQLKQGLYHNKFGAFCLQANDLQKAQKHLEIAKKIVGSKFTFSNVEMNLGNLWAQKKNYQKAIQHYQKVISISPYKEEVLGSENLIIYSKYLNSFQAYIDAHTNVAVMYVQLNNFDKGFSYCQKALQLNPKDKSSMINFTDILRQLGKKEEALKLTWEQIIEQTKKLKDPSYKGFQGLKISNWDKYKDNYKQKRINILTVKWGTRYSAEYVNKLYAGIKRHTTWQFDFYCFTEDARDLFPEIKVEKLEEGWEKWWGKVTLFKCGIKGRKFYIDLDMIITGCLDELFAYGGQFATLRSGDLACEKNHKEGYNSSVMIWEDDTLEPVYDELKANFQIINQYIVRFDFWLQMTVQNADYIQKLYPGCVVDFLADAQKKLPQNCSIVCFARKPKPEDYPSEWIHQHWVT